MWPVEGPGVLDVHAFMYFDGKALFLQSADPSSPAKMNGRPIGANWQQVEIPCTIELGRARLVYRVLDEVDLLEEDEQDKTIAAPIKVTAATPNPPAAGFAPGAFSNRHQPDDESTRFAPIQREPEPTLISPLEAQRAQAPAPAVMMKPRPAAGAPAAPGVGTSPQAWAPGGYDGPPSSTTVGPAPAPPPPTGYQDMGSVQIAMPPPPQPQMPPPQMMGHTPGYGAYGAPGMQGMPGQQPMGQMPGMQETGRLQPPPQPSILAKAKAEWAAMRTIQKVIFIAFPFVALGGYWAITTEDEPPPRRQRPVASASASASGSANAAPSVTVATTAPTATTPPSAATVMPTATGTTTAPTATVAATAPTATGSGKKPVLTLERQAADALRAGKRDQAAVLYDQLAAQHPENPAYKEAARIIRASK